MPHIKTRKLDPGFLEVLLSTIDLGECLPIIGPDVDSGLLPSRAIFVERYADQVGYPFPSDRDDLAKVTQYSRSKASDDDEAKRGFLRFIKEYLLDYAQAGLWSRCDEKLLAEVKEEFDDLSFSQVVSRLGWAEPLELREVDVYHLLADLPFRIYLTSNYHDFMELALQRVGKEPRTEFCRWHPGLEELVPSVFETDSVLEPGKPYEPTDKEPLVYHLHGFDQYPESLVLSEDDYTRQLISVATDTGRYVCIPIFLRAALIRCSLLILGYQFEDQDFKNIVDGLLALRPGQTARAGLFQTQVHDEEAKRYIERSLASLRCKVYFGTPCELVYGLYIGWQEPEGNRQ